MAHSIEGYFLLNMVMDASLIAVIARANGCFSTRRILIAAFISAGYAALTVFVHSRLSHAAIQLLLLIPVSLIICGDGDQRRWLPVFFQLFCGAAMIGGFGALFSASELSAASIACIFFGGLLALHILLTVRVHRLVSWEVSVCLSFRGRSIRFRALIDTGNRLREPISGLPVLIAESSLLHDLIPHESVCASFRQISFGGLGGGGTVKCFRPDHVWIRRGNQLIPAPEIWVAVYPGKIPGTSRALAPPSFAVIPGKI